MSTLARAAGLAAGTVCGSSSIGSGAACLFGKSLPVAPRTWLGAMPALRPMDPLEEASAGPFRDAFCGDALPPPRAEAWSAEEQFELMAVPKRKVTPSRKGMRNAFYKLPFQPFVSQCSKCGGIKMPHKLCMTCVANGHIGGRPAPPATPAS